MVVSYPMEFYKFVRDSGLSSASQMIDSWSGELVKGVNPAKDEIIIPLHNIVNSINLFVQLACIIFLCNKIQTNKGPFFSMILIFSISVSFRIVFCSIALILRTGNPDSHLSLNLTKLSLYVDYCSNLFSVTITFCLSLNRCLCFVSEKWNTRIFDKWILPVVCSVFISVAGAMAMIFTSKITRQYFVYFGFIDTVPNVFSYDNQGFRVSINRFFNAFSFGSVICYILLFKHLIKENKTVSNISVLRKRTKNRVFYHLLITAVLYLAVSIFYEALVDEFLDLSVRLQLSTFDTVALMKILAIANYFPEIYLPLSFILDTVHIWDVSKKLLCSKNRVSDVGAPTNVGNVP